jgi:hypothetical protein
MKKFAKEKEIVVSEYGIDDMKRQVFGDRDANKHDLMEAAAERYAFLISELQHAQDRKHPYLVRMFEAVALGMVFLGQRE